MQENVSSSGSPRPSSKTSFFSAGRRDGGCPRGCPWPDRGPAGSRAKNPSVASAKGLPARVARASCPMPCMAHQIAGLMLSKAFRPGQVDGVVGAMAVGRSRPSMLQWCAVQVAQRQIENHQFLQPRRGHGPQETRAAPTTRPAPRTARRERRMAARRGLAAAGVPAECSYPARRWQARRSSSESLARSWSVRPAGFEPATGGLEIRYSIH